MVSFSLHCIICPKHPTFSDISHLLTHVGSKGHLSHYFKAQVRSSQEPALQDLLLEYDQWYQKNHIERLLSQRMILKESKKTAGRQAPTRNNLPRLRKATERFSTGQECTRPLSRLVKDENLLDPQLSQTVFIPGESSVQEAQLSTLDPAPQERACVPLARYWPSTGPSSSKSSTHSPQSHVHTPFIRVDTDAGAFGNGQLSADPTEPTFQESLSLNGRPQCRSPALRPSVRGHSLEQASLGDADDEEESEGFEDKISECTRLKGIFWPGMDLFDSASPDAKRKRNQKKDGSILQQMKLNSAVVEPTELIFYPSGDLKKKRDITGQVESSPLKEESPKPRRKRSKAERQMLMNVSCNAPRGRRNHQCSIQGETKSYARSSKEASLQGRTLQNISKGREPPAQYQTLPSQSEGTSDWLLTSAAKGHKRKRDFQVYSNNPVEHQMVAKSLTTSIAHANYQFLDGDTHISELYQPHGMPFLDSEVSFEPFNAASYGDQRTASSQGQHRQNFNSLYEDYRPDLMGQNENIEPIVDQSGRIDVEAAQYNPRWRSQRYFTEPVNQVPHLSATMPPHMDFAAFHGSQHTNNLLNPLTFNFQQPATLEFPQYRQSTPHSPAPPNPLYEWMKNPEMLLPEQGDDSGDDTIDDEMNEMGEDDSGIF